MAVSVLSLLVCICAYNPWAQTCGIYQRVSCLLIQTHCLISLFPVLHVLFALCASQSHSDNCFCRSTTCLALSARLCLVSAHRLSLYQAFLIQNKTDLQWSHNPLSSKHTAAFMSLPAQKTCRYSDWKNWDSIYNKHNPWVRDVCPLLLGQKGEQKMKSK